MSTPDEISKIVEQDIWAWIHEFVTAKNEFYDYKFPPCPYARQAVLAKTVDVKVWTSGDVRKFIRENSIAMRDCPTLTTRVMAFPPRIRLQWGISDYVEELNAELISTNVFLNPGEAKTTRSKYPGPKTNDPYFIVIANSLAAVLSGAESLTKTDYYKDWPAEHYALVVERRARMAKQFGAPTES
jgi:hypothetical protein